MGFSQNSTITAALWRHEGVGMQGDRTLVVNVSAVLYWVDSPDRVEIFFTADRFTTQPNPLVLEGASAVSWRSDFGGLF